MSNKTTLFRKLHRDRVIRRNVEISISILTAFLNITSQTLHVIIDPCVSGTSIDDGL